MDFVSSSSLPSLPSSLPSSPSVLKADATLFNLSLLTSDVYAVLYRYFALNQPVSWLYGLGFFFTLGGLGLYHVPGAVNPRKRVRRREGGGEEEGDGGEWGEGEEAEGVGGRVL
jgi:solute carrier family 35 protein F1/2